MKRTTLCFAIVLMFLGSAAAQFAGYTAPQTTNTPVFTAVGSPQNSAALSNVAATVHVLNYKVSGGTPTFVQIRLTGSWDNFVNSIVQISDDATDTTSGQIVGIGYFPSVRAELIQCSNCSGTGGSATITATYSSYNAGPAPSSGSFNPSQTSRKVVMSNLAMGSGQTATAIPAPFGSTAGFLILLTDGINAFPAGSTMQVQPVLGWNLFSATPQIAIPTSGSIMVFPMPASPASSINLNYASGGAGAGTFSAYYVFTPPGGAQPGSAQPANVNNQEVTAVNAIAEVLATVSGGKTQRVFLYSVSARCSAGTANITVKDGATTIWSTGTAEVGTTTFRYQWSPGLASTPGNSLRIDLSSCGAANTGTLDVQASSF